MNRLLNNILALTCVAILGATASADTPVNRNYAIRAGKILTMAAISDSQETPRVINHGVILVSNGKIEALGPKDKITIPKDYIIIDASDHWVTPGIVESHSHNGADMRDLNDMVMQVNPELRVADCIWPEDLGFNKAVTGGVTTVHTLPGSGTNQSGFTVILKTDTSDPNRMIVRKIGALKASQAFNPERGVDLGRTRMGMSWLLRQMLDEAKDYHEAWLAYETGETEEEPEFKPEWQDMRKVFSGDIPAIVHTCTGWGMIQTAQMFGAEYNLKTIATHGSFTGHMVAEEIAKYENVYVDIGPRLLDFYGSAGTWQSTEGERFFGMGSQYVKGGVKRLSINTDAVGWGHQMPAQQDLFYQASMSARLGLNTETAIEAITINPAMNLGIDDRVGSLEPGKDADIVIKKGSLLDPAIPVDLVLIDGRIVHQRKGVNLVSQSQS